jgi:F420-dependent oxidoreductase-like protein
MRFALMIEPQQGLDYQKCLDLARHAEAAGFETLYRSDHYQSFPGPEGRTATDAWAVIAGLVRETQTIRHGTLVSPVTFRHPGNLAKVVTTIDHMSGGRVDVGLGIGWHEGEHRQLGLSFPDTPTRLQLLEEQLAILNGLWIQPDGWSFAGRHYQVDGTRFAPRPLQQPRPPVIVGTKGSRRAAALAARYADELNLYYITPALARAAFERLDDACAAIGRDPRSVRRSVLLGTVVGATQREVDARLADVRRTFAFAGSATAWMDEWGSRWLHGTPTEVAEQLEAFAENGAERIIFQDFLFDDSDMIDLLGHWAKDDLWTQEGAGAARWT